MQNIVDNAILPSQRRSSQEEKASVDGGAPIIHLVKKYIGQILHGCGNAQCRESLCHTGRLNLSGTSMRDLTPRSARAIAVSTCLGPAPESHLCPYYQIRDGPAAPETSMHDTSSFIQQLFDTSSLRRLTLASHTFSPTQPAGPRDLLRLEASLEEILRDHSEAPAGVTKTSKSTSEIVDIAHECVAWLLDQLPQVTFRTLRYVDYAVSGSGYAYATRSGQHTLPKNLKSWCDLFDVFYNQRYLRLLRHVVLIVTRRVKLQGDASHTPYGSRVLRPEELPTLRKFATKIVSESENQPNRLYALIVWLKRLFAEHWRRELILSASEVDGATLNMLGAVYNRISGHPSYPGLWAEFEISMVAIEVDHLQLAQIMLTRSHRFNHLVTWPFLFGLLDKITYFRSVNHLKMRQAYSTVERSTVFRQRHGSHILVEVPEQIQHAEQHYLLLNVSRNDILKDAFDQLWRRRRGELRKPLRVRLGETDNHEVGHDLGGVQIEFFNLICRRMFAPDADLFTTDPSTGLSHIKPGSLQPLHIFEMCGLLFALALYNGIALPVDLTPSFYDRLRKLSVQEKFLDHQLLESSVHFRASWPTVAKSLQSVLDEDIEDLEYVFPLEANGLRLNALMPETFPYGRDDVRTRLEITSATSIVHHPDCIMNDPSNDPRLDLERDVKLDDITHAWPGWHLVPAMQGANPVTSANKRQYVDDYMVWMAYGSTAPQWGAFSRGFYGNDVIDGDIFTQCFNVAELKAYVEGVKTLDITALQEVTIYDGYDAASKYIGWFWQIVKAWPQYKQMQLLKFVTASERFPLEGALKVVFVIRRQTPDTMDSLPTSSTCFGTLHLPRYATSEMLAEKLSLAVEYGSEGFGTG